jgi:hypothetical protein
LLAPLDASNKVQWDFATKSNWPLEPHEAAAYGRLKQLLSGQERRASPITITLLKNEDGF